MKNMAQLTKEDESVCRLFGILMVVAKIDASARTLLHWTDEDKVVEQLLKDYKMLMDATCCLFPNGDMEAQVTAFAKRLGFEIEQQYITDNGGTTH